MTSLRSFAAASCWLAALAYASRFKRAGHGYFAVAVGALYINAGDAAAVVYGGRMPSAIGAEPR